MAAIVLFFLSATNIGTQSAVKIPKENLGYEVIIPSALYLFFTKKLSKLIILLL